MKLVAGAKEEVLCSERGLGVWSGEFCPRKAVRWWQRSSEVPGRFRCERRESRKKIVNELNVIY